MLYHVFTSEREQKNETPVSAATGGVLLTPVPDAKTATQKRAKGRMYSAIILI